MHGLTIEQKPCVSDPKKLELVLVGLDGNKELVVRIGAWNGFYFSVIEDNVCPFFNKEGRACFYGYGNSVNRYGYEKSVVEYSIDLDNKMETYHCLYEIPDKRTHCRAYRRSFVPILNCPVLLKALLQSTQVSKISMQDQENDKNFNIEGVTIPEDYKTFKKHVVLENNRYTSYNLLPNNVKKAIDEWYKKQQREKMKIEKK